jgi:bifunctional ADP-heptose synthase (sugar kinase/adenylyltransferase)
MKKVLVIGDSCTDVFRYGNCDRLCPEAPVQYLNKPIYCSKK